MAKKTETKPPKGTRDFLPKDVRHREWVTRRIRNVYEAHGFLPLETPSFERLETLLGKYGDEGDQLVFKILHRGQPLVDGIRASHAHLSEPGAIIVGRSGETAPGAERMLADMGLRYDLTVPLARVYAEHRESLPSVFKRYQIQPVWRADSPGKGRFREFYQCDLDILGSRSSVVEAEIMGAVCQCMQSLDFRDVELLLNHRALLSAMIRRAGIDDAKASDAIVAIDKLDKIGADGVEAELEAKGVAKDARRILRDIVFGEASVDRVAAFVADDADGVAAIANLREILSLASRTPAASHVRFSPTLARGLGYYTGAIFELAAKDVKGSLGGGGRYDGLIGMFSGQDVPACGFSIGLERILVLMEERHRTSLELENIEVVVGTDDAACLPDALEFAYALREAKLRVELHPRADKPSFLRKMADERAIPFVAILRGPGDDRVNLWSRAEPAIKDATIARAEVATRVRAATS